MKKKGTWVNAVLVLIMIAGLSLLLYPTVANYWNQMHASRAISGYNTVVANMDDDQYQSMWQEAVEYNQGLDSSWSSHFLTEEQYKRYETLLNIGGSGVMGFLEIPRMKVSLPIYHGSSEGVLQVAIGHLEWSSLPVGGSGTHCVVSGHRGLPSAKLLTDLDKMEIGDTFELVVLGNTLSYEVDQIRTVLPTEVDELNIVEGKDYCTLVTCTPYGINTHRLLVRGHRVIKETAEVRVVSEAMILDSFTVSVITAAPFALALVIVGILKVIDVQAAKKRKEGMKTANAETKSGEQLSEKSGEYRNDIEQKEEDSDETESVQD